MIIGVFSNNEVKEYDSLINGFNAGAEYACLTSVERINEDPFDTKYTIEFYNTEQKVCILKYGNWKLFSTTLNVEKVKFNLIKNIKIIDPLGEVSAVKIKSQNIIDFIREFYSQLKNLSSFNSWNEIRLIKEIETLKLEIERLKRNAP